MFKSYLKTAIRNLARHRVYSAINIISMSIAIAFCILTFLFVHREWTYDAFHENADHIYRITVQYKSPFYDGVTVVVSPFLGPAISEAFPNIQTVRLENDSGKILTEDRASHDQFYNMIGFVDPNFLKVFSFPIIHGDPTRALQDRHSAVITERTAQQYFNKPDPIGELLTIQYEEKIQNYIITGIAKNVPKNSTIIFDVLLPYETHEQLVGKRDYFYSVDTYILLPPNVSPNSLEQQSSRWTNIWWGKDTKTRRSKDRDIQLKLLPITQMHFDQNLRGRLGSSNPVYSYILSGITILVLFIASVNFTILTIGRQATRAREVGLRKVVGAGRMQIAKQFIGESLLLIVIALMAGIAIAALALPIFNNLVRINIVEVLALSDGLNLTTLTFLILLVSFIGLTAGGYPALVLSRLQPTQIITSRLQIKTGNRFGGVLVIFQFTLSIFLIIVTLMMGNQLKFLRTKHLGYQTENIVTINTFELSEASKTLPTVFRDALRSYPAVISTTWFDAMGMGGMTFAATFVKYQGSPVDVASFSIDYDLFKTLGMQLVEGREFSEEFAADSKKSIIVNEALVKKFGIEDPIGKTFNYRTIIGVVRDFHFRSLHHKVEPAIMSLGTWHSCLLVRIRPDNVPGTIAFIKEQWEKVAPNHAFDFLFLDEKLDAQYRKEERWTRIIQYATGFAIFIAALGAFGLAALATARRTKEIGIRKVLGASQAQILSLLSREFALYIALASLIAFPIAYYAINQWLQTFPYRIELGLVTFLLGSFVMFIVVVTTVATQVLKAIRANPVEALRYE